MMGFGLMGRHSCGFAFQVMESLDLLLPALLDALSAPSERVVVESLNVQALIAEDEGRFRQLMHLLLDRYRMIVLNNGSY